MNAKVFGFLLFAIVLSIVESTAMGQGEPFPLNTDPIDVPVPVGDCFRTANSSCSTEAPLDANRPKCDNRICGWGEQEWVPDDPQNPTGPGHWYTPPKCVTPAFETPFEEDNLSIEVPDVAHAPDGTGRERYLEADPVDCVARFKCECTVAKSNIGGACVRAPNEYATDHPVYGLVIDSESPACEGYALPGEGGGAGG